MGTVTLKPEPLPSSQKCVVLKITKLGAVMTTGQNNGLVSTICAPRQLQHVGLHGEKLEEAVYRPEEDDVAERTDF